MDADSKLVISWLGGGRDGEYALAFMDDLASRLASRVQLTMPMHTRRFRAPDQRFLKESREPRSRDRFAFLLGRVLIKAY